MSETPDRLPPHSPEAEMGVLGCILRDDDRLTARCGCIEECVQRFKTEEVFYDLRHQEVYKAMVKLYEGQKPIDVVTLHQQLKDDGVLEKVGGLSFVVALTDATGSAARLMYYADIVWEKYLLRQLLRTSLDTARRIMDFEGDVPELFDAVSRDFLGIEQQQMGEKESGAKEFIQPAIERIENYHRGTAQMIGISTGYEYLDKMTCGFAPEQLIVIAARPGLGKTSMLMNIVERVAIGKKVPTGILSLEMSKAELGARLLFQVARADYQRFRTGAFETAVDMPKLTEAAVAISLAPVWLDDSSALNILQVRAKARRLVQLYQIKFLVIDYLQLLVPTRFYQNREQEVAEISCGLKSLAKELKIPVCVAAQLNRDFEKEPNRKPRLSDLRESGRIEADADVVAMLYKPKLKDDELAALMQQRVDWSKHWDRVNLLIAKQRSGPTGDCEMEFFKASMRFEEHRRPPEVKVNPEPKKGKNEKQNEGQDEEKGRE